MICALVGIALLYILGAGPASYIWAVSEKSHSVIGALYDPLLWKVRGTP
jgi:hypothetical protein